MFFVRRPSQETVDRFLHDSQDLPLSYGPVGIVREKSQKPNPKAQTKWDSTS